jgi:hypothetical protein
MQVKKVLVTILFINPAGQWGAGTPRIPIDRPYRLRSGKWPVLSLLTPWPFTPLRSPPLTCLITLDTLKGTNPYMIKGHPIIVHLLIRAPVVSYTCEIKDYGIPNLWPENYRESEDLPGKVRGPF